ncbi:hypothetical protein E4U17_007410, partial [Claviceps sp. LM77 group G4]
MASFRGQTYLDMRKTGAFPFDTGDHQIPEDDYQNAIISALAVLGIREYGAWHDPCEYTPILSAVVKVARMLAI